MKVFYDETVDAVYLEFEEKEPQGAVEVAEGICFDLDGSKRILGIEILDASKKMCLKQLQEYAFHIEQS